MVRWVAIVTSWNTWILSTQQQNINCSMKLCFWLLAHWSHWSHCNFIISYSKISHSLVSFKPNIFDSSIFINKTSKESEIKLHNERRHKNVENKLNFPKICKTRRLFILNPKSAPFRFCKLMKRNHKHVSVFLWENCKIDYFFCENILNPHLPQQQVFFLQKTCTL